MIIAFSVVVNNFKRALNLVKTQMGAPPAPSGYATAHTLTHSLTHSLSLLLTHSLTLTLSLTLSLSLSLSLTYTLTLTFPLASISSPRFHSYGDCANRS